MPASLAPRRRFDALDTLRCLAVLFMVQGHTFTLVIADAARAAQWYRWHNYLHGFTAPAFLFGAGLAFGVTTLHDLAPHLRWGPALQRRLYRYLSLLAIGYALQLPPLAGGGVPSARHLELFARVEALQHIGVVMLLCQGLVFILRTRGRVVAASALLCAGSVLLGPWLSRQPVEQTLPLGLAAYLTSNLGSTFPLVPWSGFLFAGIALGGVLERRAMFGPSRRLACGLVLGGLALVGVSLQLDALLPGVFGEHVYWKVSPYFFLRRLGWLAVLLGGFAIVDLALARRARADSEPGRVREYTRLISQSSLVIYVAHLLVLYGSPLYPPGLRAFSHGLSVAQGGVLAAALIAFLVWFARLWNRAERGGSIAFARLRQAGVMALSAAVLFACASGIRPAPESTRSPGASTRDEPPPARLLLSVVIDQLGSHSFQALESVLPEDGALRHLLERGRVWDHGVYPYATTFTAPGHAMLYSGAVPAVSGVSTNYVIDREARRPRAVVDDGTHAVLGHEGAHCGPGVLRVPTVADALKKQTAGRGKVVSLSLKDRAAVLPAGKRPDLVLWFDSEARGFTTSTYYAQELPAWLVDYAAAHPISDGFDVWHAHDPAQLAAIAGADDAPGEGNYHGVGTTFPHPVAESQNPYAAWGLSPASTEYMLELAFAAVQQLELGVDEVPDLLAVSISGTDYAGHVFGPDSWEYIDHLRRADRALLRLIRKLQAQTRLAVLITSDHGVAPLPERAQAALAADEAAEPDGSQATAATPLRIDPRALAAALDAAVDATFGEGEWVAGYAAPYLFLSPAALSHAQAEELRALVRETLAAQPGIAGVYDVRNAEQLDPDDPVQAAVRSSIHPQSAGDFFVVLDRLTIPDIGMTPGHGTTHGSHHDYDSSVPILVLSPGGTAQRVREPQPIGRVPSTLAALLAIEPPETATLPPLPL